MIAPTTARQYSVWRASVSCSQVNVAAPSSGPASALSPPSSTITSASTERGIASVSGEMLPLENAYSAAGEPGEGTGERERQPLRRAHVDADRLGAQRRIAAARSA